MEANLDSVEQHPHSRFCTFLGAGDNRYHHSTLLETLAVVARDHAGCTCVLLFIMRLHDDAACMPCGKCKHIVCSHYQQRLTVLTCNTLAAQQLRWDNISQVLVVKQYLQSCMFAMLLGCLSCHKFLKLWSRKSAFSYRLFSLSTLEQCFRKLCE